MAFSVNCSVLGRCSYFGEAADPPFSVAKCNTAVCQTNGSMLLARQARHESLLLPVRGFTNGREHDDLSMELRKLTLMSLIQLTQVINDHPDKRRAEYEIENGSPVIRPHGTDSRDEAT